MHGWERKGLYINYGVRQKAAQRTPSRSLPKKNKTNSQRPAAVTPVIYNEQASLLGVNTH